MLEENDCINFTQNYTAVSIMDNKPNTNTHLFWDTTTNIDVHILELTDEDGGTVVLRVVRTQRLSVLLLIHDVFVVLKHIGVLN
jgi:hypothetical protein